MIRSLTRTVYVVRCDRCGNQNRIVADGFTSEELAVEDAIAHGWQMWEDLPDEPVHTCPTCLLTEPCS